MSAISPLFLWLRQNGLESAIRKAASSGTLVFGICGGYQMLGRKISDPDNAEGGGETAGLSLLPVDTVLKGAKTRRIFDGVISEPSGVLEPLKGAKVRGYEIHMGVTEPFGELSEFTSDGTGYCRGNVYGSYVHGLFDTKESAGGIVERIAADRGKSVDTKSIRDHAKYKEEQYDLLADAIRKNLDMDKIYDIMGLSR